MGDESAVHVIDYVESSISYVSKCDSGESMHGGTKKLKPNKTASIGIDPRPLPTCQRRDDIPVEACKQPFSKTLASIPENVVPLPRILILRPNSSRDRTEVS